MTKLLDKINSPKDLHLLNIDELTALADEIREFITQSVSQTGGHLASNLGVIEMTIAMHYVFDFKTDHLLWDVGHQCYAHKIITGRKDQFDKLRCRDGISGFPDPAESPYDRFRVGHAGTSIPTALGMGLGSKLKNSNEKIVALVGDASIVNGTNFEALNNLGLLKRQLLVVLNDNSMAIDVTTGAIASFLSKVRLSHSYEEIRKTTHNILEHLPVIGKSMDNALENFKRTLRMSITPSRLFESLALPYFGPVDGHDIGSMIELFRALSQLDQPAVLHVYTKKGKGFTPADDNPRKFHSTGPFTINGSTVDIDKAKEKFTDAFAKHLVDLAERDKDIVAISAAMPDGTGLDKFRKKFPERFYDTGIAETAAVDIAAGLAKQGLKPFVCIYSTFLQRSFDHIFQEVSLQNLPVIFCLDRAGFVGNDGPTHHGLLDISYLRQLPNMVIAAPADSTELKNALLTASQSDRPFAIRYPKDIIAEQLSPESARPFEPGKCSKIKQTGCNTLIISLGSLLKEAIKASEILVESNIEIDIVNARFAKPIDPELISSLCNYKYIITLEDHVLAGGFGSAILEAAAKYASENANVIMPRITNLACTDSFVEAAPRKIQLEQQGLTAEKIVQTVKDINRLQNETNAATHLNAPNNDPNIEPDDKKTVTQEGA